MKMSWNVARVPGAAQHEVMRCRTGTPVSEFPTAIRLTGVLASAMHRQEALHRVRDTEHPMTELSRNEHIKEASDYLRGTLAKG